ncbi:MAG: SDR family NAD(P)-dependent oxidoreductase [Ilumatobacteraceae bacterium]
MLPKVETVSRKDEAAMCEARRVETSPRPTRALITGASSGIGTAFAEWFANEGCEVVLVARDGGMLSAVADRIRARGGTCEVVVADLSHKDGVETAVARAGEVDVLVCNAGLTHAASLGASDRNQLDALAYLMSTGVVRLCEALVPTMVRHRRGDVVIVSSIAAFTPMRKAGPYAAAKAHSTSYARSLSLEVRDKGVRVVAVCPGYVRTDLHRRAGLEHLTGKVPDWMWLDAQDVVRATVRALRRGRVVVVPGLVYRLVLPFLTSSVAQRTWRRMTRRR